MLDRDPHALRPRRSSELEPRRLDLVAPSASPLALATSRAPGSHRAGAARRGARSARHGGALALAVGLIAGCMGDVKSDKRESAEGTTKQAVRAAPGSDCMRRGGAITLDVTLTRACSPYTLEGGIDVINGATLTIEPGVEIRFHDGDWLEIGATGRPGRLVARGTPDAPIVITAADPDTSRPERPGKPPSWLGLWFHSGTLPGSVLTHAVIRKGGGENAHIKPPLPQGCITLTGVAAGALELDHVEARECLLGAFLMSESAMRAGSLTFVDSPAGFVVDAASMRSLIAPATYRGVTHNVITGGEVREDAEWVPQDVPFVVRGRVHVGDADGASLALSPGLELRFQPDTELAVGVSGEGRLIAKGTAKSPVKLASSGPDATWRGLVFGERTAQGSALEHVEIGGTSGDGALRVLTQPGRVSLEGVTFADNAVDLLVGCGAAPKVANARYGSKKGLVEQSPCP